MKDATNAPEPLYIPYIFAAPINIFKCHNIKLTHPLSKNTDIIMPRSRKVAIE